MHLIVRMFGKVRIQPMFTPSEMAWFVQSLPWGSTLTGALHVHQQNQMATSLQLTLNHLIEVYIETPRWEKSFN